MGDILDKELEILRSELEAKMPDSMKEYRSVLSNYKSKDWQNWLEDILEYGVAYPVSNLTGDGDVIIDMIDVLRKEAITTIHYQRGLSEALATFYPANVSLTYIESILNALIALGGSQPVDTLLNILQSNTNNLEKGKYDYIKSLTLLTLARLNNLSDLHKTKVYSYMLMRGFHKMKHDPVFYGSALSFVYRHLSTSTFFDTLSLIIKILSEDDGPKNSSGDVSSKCIDAIVDKIEELHFSQPSDFYSSICHWILKIGQKFNDISLVEFNTFKEVISRILNLITSGFFSEDETETKEIFHFEPQFIKSFKFLIFLLSEMKNIDLSVGDAVKANAYLIVTMGQTAKNFLQSTLKKRQEYIQGEPRLRLIPQVAPEFLKEQYDKATIESVIELYDEALYQPEKKNSFNVDELLARLV